MVGGTGTSLPNKQTGQLEPETMKMAVPIRDKIVECGDEETSPPDPSISRETGQLGLLLI